MSKFNKKSTGTQTINRAGGIAYDQSDELKFASLLLTSFVQSQYYRSEDSTIREVKNAIKSLKDKKFAAQAAVFARNEYGMRSISHLVASEIVKSVKGETWTKDFITSVVRRPDDMTEIVAAILNGTNKSNRVKIPNSLKKGLAKAFGKFNAYQLSKYRSEGKAVSLVDVVNLVHPRPTERNGTAIRDLINGNLRSTDTWESKLTQAGQTASSDEDKAEKKKEVWESLIRERKLGYFAAIRNARNILQQAPNVVNEYCEYLVDENLIRKSLVLPFRYTTAIKEIQLLGDSNARKVVMALSRAMDISLQNVPAFDGETLVILDDSGSMSGKPIEIGSLFAAALVKKNNCDLMMFSTSARYVSYNPLDSLSTIRDNMMKNLSMSGTNFHAPIRAANKAYDRIIILSDMQGWMDSGYWWGGSIQDRNKKVTTTFAEYKRQYDCSPNVFSFDLQGYGSLQFPEPQVYCLAGFSEKVFDIMSMLESDKQALVNKIKSIEF